MTTVAQTFETIAIFILALYVLETLVMVYALKRKFPTTHFAQPPRVSVVVAARNEEKNIGRCLESLIRLDYPAAHLEIIIADDRSTDRTADLIKGYAARFPAVHYLLVAEAIIKGKGNAIDQAVKASTGEFILMTDADCTVNPLWAKEIVKYFTADTGLVCSTTIPRSTPFLLTQYAPQIFLTPDSPEKKPPLVREPFVPMTPELFARVQALEWSYLLSMGSAMAAIGNPIGGIGNNFSFRKRVYEEVGGYAKIKFSVTEDFAFFQAIRKTRWKIAYPLEGSVSNSTEPLPTFAELYRQKKRWILGGADAEWSSLASLILGLLTHLSTFLALFILPFTTALILLAVKVFIDAVFLITPLWRLGSGRLIVLMPLFEVLYYFTVIVLPAALLFDRKIVWKGRVYS